MYVNICIHIYTNIYVYPLELVGGPSAHRALGLHGTDHVRQRESLSHTHSLSFSLSIYVSISPALALALSCSHSVSLTNFLSLSLSLSLSISLSLSHSVSLSGGWTPRASSSQASRDGPSQENSLACSDLDSDLLRAHFLIGWQTSSPRPWKMITQGHLRWKVQV